MALSLVYVSIENGVGRGFVHPRKTPPDPLRHRWVVALVFGLFHGLGFAIALQETLQFAGSHPIAALVAYNVGLELGTLIILAIVRARGEPAVHAGRPGARRHHRRRRCSSVMSAGTG